MQNSGEDNTVELQTIGSYFKDMTSSTSPLYKLKTPPFIEEAREILERHGCRLDEYPTECTIHFPEGTTRTEIFPRMMTARYRIRLADGYELREVYDKYREISMLSYTRE